MCPKPCFGHTYKVSAWNFHHKCDFWCCVFSRDYFGELVIRLWNNPLVSDLGYQPKITVINHGNENSYIFIQENAFENVVCEMSAILSRPQCVNKPQYSHYFLLLLPAPQLLIKQERLKCQNTLGCLDQYAAQNSKYARPPIPSQPPTQSSSSSGTLNMIPPWNIHTVKQSMPRRCSNCCSLNWFIPSEFFKFSQLTN